MTVQDLLRAGELKAAIAALGGEVRDHPTDTRRRTFLFELLCFAGEYSRAEKHLTLLADAGQSAQVGGLLYRSAIVAERKRQQFFTERQYAGLPSDRAPRSGKLNGTPFQTIEDADPRIGDRFEVFLAGEYMWLPFAHIGTLQMPPPRFLRDLLWGSATITGSPAMESKDFGEVLLPVLYPFSFQHADESIRLGRGTDWVDDIPFGQKLLVLDGETIVPLLEVRTLEFDDADSASSSEPAA